MEAGTSFPNNSTKLRTQPPYDVDGVYKIHTDCECEWHTSYLGKKYNRKELTAPVLKIIPKTESSEAKLLEEIYCQSAQKQCKLLTLCNWHKSPYATEYYGQTVVDLKEMTKPKPEISVGEQQGQLLTKNYDHNILEQHEEKPDRIPSVHNIKADFVKFLDELQLRNKENTLKILQQTSQPRKVSERMRILDNNTELQSTQERNEFFDFLGLKRLENPTTFLSQLKEEVNRRHSDDDQVLPKLEPKIKGRKKRKKKKKKKIHQNSP